MIILNGNIIIDQNHFPDHTLLLKINNQQFDYRSTISYEWHYENDSELFTLICLRKHFAKYSHHQLVMPYIPHARMDRVKTAEDVFTLKYFCEVINSLNFDEVFVLDPHSNVSTALLNNVVIMEVGEYIQNAIQEIPNDPVFYFPDEGAMKRYSEHAPGAYAFGIKKRDWETGQIQGIQIQNEEVVKGKDILIIDDICSKGGTFYYSAKALKKAGAANIYLYVSHLEESIFDGDLWKNMTTAETPLIKKVFTANPLFVLGGGVTQIKKI